MPTFTTNWFDRHEQTFLKFLAPLKGKKNLNFLEIGSFEGKSSVWLMDNILVEPDGHLFCCDTFEGSIEHKEMNIDTINLFDRFMANVKAYGNRVVVLKAKSQEMLREMPKYYFDFIYIDGSHHSSDVLEDSVQVWRLLKQNGIMAWDDYHWSFHSNRYGTGELNITELYKEPKLAIDSFLACFHNQYEELEHNDQVWIKKL